MLTRILNWFRSLWDEHDEEVSEDTKKYFESHW